MCEEEDVESIFNKIRKIRSERIFTSIFMPIAMKVASTTIGVDLVSVQPLSSPIGRLFYTDRYYDSRMEKIKRILEKL